MAFSIVTFILLCLHIAKAVIVEVEQGKLRGSRQELVTGDGRYYSFLGVNYAASPVGKLRFMPPQPLPSWTGIKDAIEPGDACLYYDVNKTVIGSEDCLNLNIFTPDLTPAKPLTVMVYIHGGDFTVGSANEGLYGPDFIVQQNVILVILNFRQGVFGFLSLESKEVPGNNGLKDQVAALQWIKRNIAKFGGDPDNVTIFGGTTGAACVALHTLSPLSNGLFNRAISMSGSPLNDFATEFQPKRHAIALGKEFGVYINDTIALLKFLQSVPAKQLLFTNPSIYTTETVMRKVDKINYFVPVIETNFTGDHFLTIDVLEALATRQVNKVDYMIGYNRDEAIYTIATYADVFLKVYTKYPEMLVPVKILINALPCTILELSDIICRRYMSGLVSVNQVRELVTYFSDSKYYYDIIRYIRYWPAVGNVYQYRFSTYTSRNIYGRLLEQYGVIGISGRDDVLYLFNAANVTVDVNSEVYKLIVRTVTLFTNFAKYGNPTPSSSLGVIWPQYNPRTQQFLDIGNVLTIGARLGVETYNFWRTIYEYAGLPY